MMQFFMILFTFLCIMEQLLYIDSLTSFILYDNKMND